MTSDREIVGWFYRNGKRIPVHKGKNRKDGRDQVGMNTRKSSYNVAYEQLPKEEKEKAAGWLKGPERANKETQDLVKAYSKSGDIAAKREIERISSSYGADGQMVLMNLRAKLESHQRHDELSPKTVQSLITLIDRYL